jgi:hypothetical protein
MFEITVTTANDENTHCVTTTGRISGVGVYLCSIQLTQLAVFLQFEVLDH